MLMISIADIEQKAQSSHAHALLRECLKRKGIVYEKGVSAVVKNQYGKPSLADYPEVHYNVSHAVGICACIVSDTECGIDCEKVRDYRPGVMKRAFSETEKALVENAPDRDLMFFRLWTLKESYIKAIGMGLSYPLKDACFDLTESGIVSAPEGYRFRQYVLKGGYVVSVCERSQGLVDDKASDNGGDAGEK